MDSEINRRENMIRDQVALEKREFAQERAIMQRTFGKDPLARFQNLQNDLASLQRQLFIADNDLLEQSKTVNQLRSRVRDLEIMSGVSI